MKLKDKMNLMLQKVYQIGKKHEAPRIWLQSIVCEAAGLHPGSELHVHVNDDDKEIVIQNQPFDEVEESHTVHVSSRVNKTSGLPRPLVDTAKAEYGSILNVQEKVEILVYRDGGFSRVVVRPLHFKLFETETIERPDERIRLLSLFAGAGVGTSVFKSSGYFTPVQEVEFEDDSCENLKLNYPNSFVFNGDIRDLNTVVKSDVVFVTAPCNESSSLGSLEEGCFNNLTLATAKIIKASEAKIVLFENVPNWYKSNAFMDLRELLLADYPYWIGPVNLESHDFGSLAKRSRNYSICFHEKEQMQNFRLPSPPKTVKRKKLREFLDPTGTLHEWKPLDKWMESFNSKVEKGNSWADRSIDNTFVDGDATMIQCIARRYRSHSASNTYLLNDDKTMWRFLSINELRKIMYVPEDFQFSCHTPIWRQFEQLGQSVCGRVIKCLANELARVFFKSFMKKNDEKETKDIDEMPVTLNASGQIELLFA